jgi:hypothetical protein
MPGRGQSESLRRAEASTPAGGNAILGENTGRSHKVRLEIAGKFVVSCGDAPPILNATEVVLDGVAPFVKTLEVIRLLCGIVSARNNRQGAFVLNLLPHFLAVVGLVGRDGEWRIGSVEDLANGLAILNLAACDGEVQWTALIVDDGMDFCGATAATNADRLILLPP